MLCVILRSRVDICGFGMAACEACLHPLWGETYYSRKWLAHDMKQRGHCHVATDLLVGSDWLRVGVGVRVLFVSPTVSDP